MYIYLNACKRVTDVKLLLLPSNTWNHLTVYKLDSNTWNNLTVLKKKELRLI